MQYIVKSNDTLNKIANFYNIDIESLKKYNNLIDDSLEEGMVINIPSDIKLGYYRVVKGDDLFKIANKYAIPVSFLAKINGLTENDEIYPEQELFVPKEGYGIYITEKGDSINSVLNKLGIDEEKIVDGNHGLYLVEEQLIIYEI